MGVVRKREGNYFIDYRVNGRRYREFIGTNKKLAQEVLHKRLTEIAENRFLDKKNTQNIEFSKFAEEYIELYAKNNKKSWETDLQRIKPLKEFFSGKLLHQIDSLMVEAYKAKRKENLSYATVNRELALLKHIFTIAIQWGKAEDNPVKKVKLFRENNERVRFLEKEEAERLVKNCNGYLKRIVIIALNTGMRKGEILSLKWQDIDYNRGIIYVRDTKNGEKKELPMNELVKQALIRQPKHKDSSYVFCNRNGQPFGDIKKSFLAAIQKSAIINFRFHDLRHSFASSLAMRGVDLNTIRELMGHKSMRMTLRYSHLSPSHKQRAVGVLEQVWALDGHKRQSEINSPEVELEESNKIKDFSQVPR